MRAKVNYTCDWSVNNNDDQGGRIIIEPDSGGCVTATWLCEGGKGRGCELRENTTKWPDDFVEFILDTPDLCMGQGKFIADVEDIDLDKYEPTWPKITLIKWIG